MTAAASTTRLRLPPPSRRDNPFATCWTRPGALPFHFSNGQTAEQLAAKLVGQHWRGAIIGPHGSGKSTLLETLKPALVAAGRSIHAISLHDGQRRLPRRFFRNMRQCSLTRLVIIDGYEQLGWSRTPSSMATLPLGRRRIARDLTLTRAISNARSAFARPPTRRATRRRFVRRSVHHYHIVRTSPLAMPAMAATSARFFFDLYDRHEQRRRESNPCAAAIVTNGLQSHQAAT